jgi:hypothetical protein
MASTHHDSHRQVLPPGTQLNSKRPTSSRAVFGTGRREDADKQYLDAELEKCRNARNTPGPVYKHLLGLGKQPLSTAPTNPRAHFGTAPRWNRGSSFTMNATPGAGQYGYKSGLGKQVFSKQKTLPGGTNGASEYYELAICVLLVVLPTAQDGVRVHSLDIPCRKLLVGTCRIQDYGKMFRLCMFAAYGFGTSTRDGVRGVRNTH